MVETKGKPMVSNFPTREERIFYGRIPLGKGDRGKADVELLPRGESANVPQDPEAGIAIDELQKD